MLALLTSLTVAGGINAAPVAESKSYPPHSLYFAAPDDATTAAVIAQDLLYANNVALYACWSDEFAGSSCLPDAGASGCGPLVLPARPSWAPGVRVQVIGLITEDVVCGSTVGEVTVEFQ